MKSVADLVNDLFRTHRKPNGREYTHQEIAEALGGRIDPTNISKIRTGKIKDPRRETLLALGQFFKVPGNYFFPELEEFTLEPGSDVERDSIIGEDIIILSTRSSLDERTRRKIREIVDAIRKRED